MGLMFSKRRQDSAKAFAAAKAKAHSKNHAKAHQEAGNLAVGQIVSTPAPKAEEKKAKDGSDKSGAK